jgi:hypothetical protein
MKAAPVTFVLVAALAASPALALERETIPGAAMQPLRDLSVIRQETPQVLQKAAEAPYAAAGDCELMRQEIADLDAVLGDDLDAVNDDGGTLMTTAVKSVVRLPFSGIIRRITGAQKRDQAYQDALVAGVARRAYLKGALTACTQAPPLVPEMAVTVPLVPETAPTGDAKVVVATTP